MILPIFKAEGNIPWATELLKIKHNGVTKYMLEYLSILTWISSKPGAFFEGKLWIALRISFSDIGKTKKELEHGCMNWVIFLSNLQAIRDTSPRSTYMGDAKVWFFP